MTDTMTDKTEAIRRDLIARMPVELHATIHAGKPYWTTDEMRELFTVEAFSAPFVVVRRKADGAVGSLKFTHSPRYYFEWMPHND